MTVYIGKKILKLLVSVIGGIFLFNKMSLSDSSFIDKFLLGAVMIIFIYIAISLFSFLLHLSRNYLIAAIVWLIICGGIAYIFDYLDKKLHLPSGVSVIIVLIIAAIMIIVDIHAIISHFAPVRAAFAETDEDTDAVYYEYESPAELTSNTPQSVNVFSSDDLLSCSARLEKVLGRKPTVEEIAAFMHNDSE